MDNISLVNGIEHYAGAKPAWHNLGVNVGKSMTAEEALKLAHLDYNVELQPLTTLNGVMVENHYATVRTDVPEGLPLGVVGNKYTVVQNTDAFSFFDLIVDKNEAIYESVGALGNGEKIFITAKLPDTIEVAKSCVDMYICFFNSHDGSTPAQALFTPVYVVCANTMAMALKNCTNKVNLRHTRNVKDRFAQAIELMQIKTSYMGELKNTISMLSNTKVTAEHAKRIIEQVFIPAQDMKAIASGNTDVSTRAKNIVEQVMGYYFEHPYQQQVIGTAFGVYNAVTGFFQNVKEFKTDEQKMRSIFMGGTAETYAQRALTLLTAKSTVI